jgi:uncharacterized membrane protein YdjX (TVP38/TMEM64 family)
VVERGVTQVSGLIGEHPFLGALAFTGLAALSAMLAFFSSAIVVPVGVHHWGELATIVLLWLGWLLGGATTYLIGRYLGSGVMLALVKPERVAFYRERISRRASFGLVLLFQTAVPSEIPGYVLGTARYSFPRYFAALALAELPYALGAVFLGAGFLKRQYGLLIVLGGVGIVFLTWAVKRLHRALGNRA